MAYQTGKKISNITNSKTPLAKTEKVVILFAFHTDCGHRALWYRDENVGE